MIEYIKVTFHPYMLLNKSIWFQKITFLLKKTLKKLKYDMFLTGFEKFTHNCISTFPSCVHDCRDKQYSLTVHQKEWNGILLCQDWESITLFSSPGVQINCLLGACQFNPISDNNNICFSLSPHSSFAHAIARTPQ